MKFKYKDLLVIINYFLATLRLCVALNELIFKKDIDFLQ